jgi:hypothetical protein
LIRAEGVYQEDSGGFMRKIFLLCCLIALMYSTEIKAQNLASDVRVLADKGRSFEERKADILRRWNELRPVFTGNAYYDIAPSYRTPYGAGKIKDAYLKDALNMLNFYRFLVGVPDDVELSDEFIELAQHGSVLNAAHKAIAHQQPRPPGMDGDFYIKASEGIGGSNLGQGYDTLINGVNGWMDDSDEANWDKLGHRRWALNPAMQYTGFGFVDGFDSMYVFDASRRERPEYQAVCFPGGAAFPSDFFGSRYAWSVSLNASLYQEPNYSDVLVTLTELSGGKTWKFPGNGGYFNIDTQGFGIPICIIFQPQGIDGYSGTYRVEIEGLKTIAGQRVSLNYETRFFPLEVVAGPSDFKTAVNETGTITITGYTGRMQNLVIPDKLNNTAVTAIGKGAFTYSEIRSITLPGSIKTIEGQSLWYSKMESIDISQGVTTIGDQAFFSCANLESITIPPSINEIGNFAFMDCKSLTTVTIPPGTIKIGYGAFTGCDNLDPAVRSALTDRFGSVIFQTNRNRF